MAVNITYSAGNINPIISLPAGAQVALTVPSGSSAYVQYGPTIKGTLDPANMTKWPAGTLSNTSATQTLVYPAAIQVVVVTGTATLVTVDPSALSYPVNNVWDTQVPLSATDNAGTPYITSQNGTRLTVGQQNLILQQRALRQQAFLAGVLNVAPAWAATTAYTIGTCVSLPTGQHICCTTAGTSSASAPTGNITGRPITDGTVTWYATPWFQTANAFPVQQGSNPSVTYYASPALATAALATLTNTVAFTAATGPVKYMTCNDALLVNASSLGGSNVGVGTASFAPSTSATGQNATNTLSLAVTGGITAPNGATITLLPGNSYGQTQSDIEFYVTDIACFIAFNPFQTSAIIPILILVDDQLLQGGPSQITGSASNLAQGFLINWNGVLKRRKITVCIPNSCDGSNAYQAYPVSITMTAQGKVEAATPSNDVMLALGDSSLVSTLPLVSAQPHQTWYIKRLLGLGGVVNCGTPGNGYLAVNGNGSAYNVFQQLQNQNNLNIWAQFPIRHVLVSAGYNDRAAFTQAQIAAQALLTWQTIRSIWPLAKITVTDGESAASGPDTNAINTAATLLATFNTWNDPNSRFIQIVGTGQQTAWIWGTGNVTGGLVTGNACELISSDGNHCSLGQAVYYYAQRMALAMNLVWNGDY